MTSAAVGVSRGSIIAVGLRRDRRRARLFPGFLPRRMPVVAHATIWFCTRSEDASAEPPLDEAAVQRFAQLARSTMNSLLLASSLPIDNAAVAALREQSALANDDHQRAESLLAAAEVVVRSAATSNPSASGSPAAGSSALIIAAQDDERGRDLVNSRDHAGAVRLFAAAAGGDARRDAAAVYRQAYQFVVPSAADFSRPARSRNQRDLRSTIARWAGDRQAASERCGAAAWSGYRVMITAAGPCCAASARAA